MLPRRASPEPKINATNVVIFMKRGTKEARSGHLSAGLAGKNLVSRWKIICHHRSNRPVTVRARKFFQETFRLRTDRSTKQGTFSVLHKIRAMRAAEES